MNEWQAKVVERAEYGAHAIYISRRLGGNRQFLLPGNKDVVIKPGEQVGDDPYLALLETDQLQALAEALNESGIKTRPIHQLEGTLAAQTAHLEDMRTLVFDRRAKR